MNQYKEGVIITKKQWVLENQITGGEKRGLVTSGHHFIPLR